MDNEIEETPPPVDPDDTDPPKQDEWRRLAKLRDAVRTQLGAHEEWIVGEFEMIEKELGWVRSRLLAPRKNQPVIWFTHPKEVLDAVDNGVIDRREARRAATHASSAPALETTKGAGHYGRPLRRPM